MDFAVTAGEAAQMALVFVICLFSLWGFIVWFVWDEGWKYENRKYKSRIKKEKSDGRSTG